MRSSIPQDGDVVVTSESKSAGRYTVRRYPGAVQLRTPHRDEAVRLARAFAQRHRVDLWYRENGTDLLLEAFRSLTADPPPVRTLSTGSRR